MVIILQTLHVPATGLFATTAWTRPTVPGAHGRRTSHVLSSPTDSSPLPLRQLRQFRPLTASPFPSKLKSKGALGGRESNLIKRTRGHTRKLAGQASNTPSCHIYTLCHPHGNYRQLPCTVTWRMGCLWVLPKESGLKDNNGNITLTILSRASVQWWTGSSLDLCQKTDKDAIWFRAVEICSYSIITHNGCQWTYNNLAILDTTSFWIRKRQHRRMTWLKPTARSC